MPDRSPPANEIKLHLVVEQHSDGFLAYPLGLKGVVVAEGDSYKEAVTELTSAIRFHLDTFGPGELDFDDRPLHAFVDCIRIEV